MIGVTSGIKAPMDVIFTPCNGKVALTDIDFLPKDSRIIIFSDSDKLAWSINLQATLNNLSSNEFTLERFYHNYLAQVFSMDESPGIYVVGGGSTFIF